MLLQLLQQGLPPTILHILPLQDATVVSTHS